MSPRAVRSIGLFATALLAAVCLRVLATSGGLELPSLIVLRELRAPALVSAMTIGAALAVAGVLLQALLRNPLAEPWMLGLLSGAGFGVVVWTLAGYLASGAIVRQESPVIPAAAGAFAALGLVYGLSQRRGLVDPVSLILIGVVISVIAHAASQFMQAMLPDSGLALYRRWLMGGISADTAWGTIGLVAGITFACIAIAAWLGPSMDAASLSDDEARSVGVGLARLRIVSFALAGILTAGTVLLAGPIGFVGLICPHLARLLGGPRHRGVVIGSALAGAALLVLADAAAQMLVLRSGHVPVGVLTAIVGGPLFIVLLRRGRWLA